MRVFVSADIEGVAGITAADESRKGGAGYPVFRAQMDAEVAAVCAGAWAAGATDVVVKDAHGDGRNLMAAALPAPTRLVRGYNGHPFAMVQGLDDTFDVALFVGYHSRAGSGGNPLSHTLSRRTVVEMRLDGDPVSEFRLHALAAGSVGVPVGLVSGDQALCEEVGATIPGCTTFAVSAGIGASTTSLHPEVAVEGLGRATEQALRSPLPPPLEPEGAHRLEVEYHDPSAAYVRGFYPGATSMDDRTVAFEADSWFEALRALIFLVGL